MIKEIYSIKTQSTALTVTNTEISAIQKSNTAKTGLRLYDNGFIGVAGAIGPFDEARLEERARRMLDVKIPYDCEPAKDIRRTEDLTGEFALTGEEFVQKSEQLLGMMRREFPLFSFSHKITVGNTETSLRNDMGADLVCRDKFVQAELLIKHRKSKNMMDSFGADVSRGFDVDSFFKTLTETCACYEEKAELPAEKMPVVMRLGPEAVLGKFYSDLYGLAMGTEASVFSGKTGQKLFAGGFSLCVNRNPRDDFRCFFDAEGTVLPNDSFALIENGMLISPYSSKKIAGEYGYAATGSSGGAFDSVPAITPEGIGVRPGGRTIKELLDGRKAVYITLASGGDFTPQGEFASPVQSAFLFDGQRLLGRLPQIAMRSNVYDMFGKDFIGMSSDGYCPGSPFKYLAMEMNVDVIGDWI